MARVKRIFRIRNKIRDAGVVSHVTQRAPGRELLFLEKADYQKMLHLTKEIAKKFSIEIFCFTFLPNHIHYLERPKKDNISEAMKNLFEKYANFHNDKYQRKGHVFCGPYGQAACFDDSYLLTISLYIHLNALKAGLVKNPLDYPWSSCRLYVTPVGKETFINYRFILNMLHKDINKAREIYKDLLVRAIPINVGNVLEDEKAMEKFRSEINRIIDRDFRTRIKDYTIFNVDIDKKIEELKNKKALKTPQEFKSVKYLVEQLHSRGYKISEIAERLNMSRQSLYNYLKKER